MMKGGKPAHQTQLQGCICIPGPQEKAAYATVLPIICWTCTSIAARSAWGMQGLRRPAEGVALVHRKAKGEH